LLLATVALAWLVTSEPLEPIDDVMTAILNEGPPVYVVGAEALRLGLLPDSESARRNSSDGSVWRIDNSSSAKALTIYTARADGRPSLSAPVIATLNDRAIAGGAVSPLSNHAAYCAARGYDYAVRVAPYAPHAHVFVAWHKLLLIRHLFRLGYPLVMWTDYDAVFTDCGSSLYDVLAEGSRTLQLLPLRFWPSLLFNGDTHTALNSGTLVFRRTRFADAFLARAFSQWGRWASCSGKAACTRAAAAYLCGQYQPRAPSDQGALLLTRRDGLPDCERALVRQVVTSADCAAVMATLSARVRANVRCLPQQQLNAYPPHTGYLHRARARPPCAEFGSCAARDTWWSETKLAVWRRGRFRMHAAGGSALNKAQVLTAAMRVVKNGLWIRPDLECAPPHHQLSAQAAVDEVPPIDFRW
jgi:hypothetical protein